jgi:beta-lactamase superfamily II metal-dependent hydrolase
VAGSAFAAYPVAIMRKHPRRNGTPVQELIWGDFIRLLGPREGDWHFVRGRNEEGWVHDDCLQRERLLEINFVDVGQGDGALIVTPDDKRILVDAGRAGNMLNYLTWRFNLHKRTVPLPIQAAVISHPDEDHYGGFKPIFEDPKITFETIYHSGIVERAGGDSLGPRVDHDGESYLTDLILTHDELSVRLDDTDFVGGRHYPTLLRTAMTNQRVDKIRALGADDRFLPGYGPDRDLHIEVVGPVYETIGERKALRWLSSVGETKNGHSVIVQLRYRQISILLGGDLNEHAEHYLLRHYTARDPESEDPAEQDAVIAAAAPVFTADVAKACHHGSGEFTDLFLRCVQAIATVISSGDDESYAHPTPDALGAIGKYGRGTRPLIFSTELARSSREYVETMVEQEQETARLERMEAAARTPAGDTRPTAAIEQTRYDLGRNVAVYGMINLRTDGEKVVLSYKLDRPKGSREFDVHCLEPVDGQLTYVPNRDKDRC